MPPSPVLRELECGGVYARRFASSSTSHTPSTTATETKNEGGQHVTKGFLTGMPTEPIVRVLAAVEDAAFWGRCGVAAAPGGSMLHFTKVSATAVRQLKNDVLPSLRIVLDF